MNTQDIRWQQRFSNYAKAFVKLEEAVLKILKDYPVREDGTINDDLFLDDIIKEGLIQRFEYTHELAWNVMKDFLADAGEREIYGSKDATRKAFAAGLIENGDVWMDMIASRNKTSHTYNEETADDIFLKIIREYYPQFKQFKNRMEQVRNAE
ncbi:MAG: nucleotidyltransferase substrate binding protein [Cytophagaceae bacterium]|nr:nucleotidyltransferase substrate binding protein [Cytophagaceae bacterium]MDW8457409.1 nucleotidyltransferase substrate binding protein [Cytophagaceae bacterium]